MAASAVKKSVLLASNDDLPASVKGCVYDDAARTVFRGAFNEHVVAKGELYAFVKAYRALADAGWEKNGTGWVRKAEPSVGDVHVDRPLGAIKPGKKKPDDEPDIFKYSEDQERDDRGRFGSGVGETYQHLADHAQHQSNVAYGASSAAGDKRGHEQAAAAHEKAAERHRDAAKVSIGSTARYHQQQANEHDARAESHSDWKVEKYSSDQERDGRGRFGSGSGYRAPSAESQSASVAGMKAQMAHVSDMMGGRGKDAFILEHGQPFTMTSKTFDGARGTPKQCYMNATQAAMRDPSLTYVEGKVDIGPLAIDHAWTVDKEGNVHDPTLKPDNPSSSVAVRGYYGVPFSTDYLTRTMVATRVYGVISHTNPTLFTAKGGFRSGDFKKSEAVEKDFDESLHPRDSHGRFGSGSGEQSQNERIRSVVQRMDADPKVQTAEQTIISRGDARDDPGVQDGQGHYTPAADAENRKIAEGFLNPAAKNLSGPPTAVFMLGKPGSGKTTTVNAMAGKLPTSVSINSDVIKERLPGYEPMMANAYHERSCDIARGYLAPEAVSQRMNVTFDMTDNSERLLRTAQALKDAGYKIGVIHVHVDSATSVERAYSRFETKGRYVAARTVLSYGERPRAAYDAVKGIADHHISFDNSNGLRLTESGGSGVFK